MGVKGLKKLIKCGGDELLIMNHRLHNVKIVISADNLARVLLKEVDDQRRLDRVGMNLVAYGKYVELFFDNLRKCKIEPILVFDGVQTIDVATSTTSKKTEKIEHLELIRRHILEQTDYRDSDFVYPTCIYMILKSVAIEKKVQVKQCFSKSYKCIAKLANQYDAYVLSSDSHFFIFDIKKGVILMESLNIEVFKKRKSEARSGEKTQPHFYIECELYDQNHFVKAFPGLDKECLPLLASKISQYISSYDLRSFFDLVAYEGSLSHRKMLGELLDFLRNKSLEQSIESLIELAGEDIHKDLRAEIKEVIKFYDLAEDDFDKEISKHYKEAFCKTYSSKFDEDPVKANDVAEKEMQLLSHWLRKKMETSNLTKTCLELALRSTDCIQLEIVDTEEPGAFKCAERYLSVQLALMRSSHTDNSPASFYYQEDKSIEMFEVKPSLELKYCGSIDHLIYDVCDKLSDDIVVDKLRQIDRNAILLATFHCTLCEFSVNLNYNRKTLLPQHAEEFAVLKMLINYVELEDNVKFQPAFRKSVLLTYLYYLHFGDSEVITNIVDDTNENHLEIIFSLNLLTRICCLEEMNQGMFVAHDDTAVRNIAKIQNAIRGYEELNAFLGTTLPTLRMHKWFNSNLIFNLKDVHEQEYRRSR